MATTRQTTANTRGRIHRPVRQASLTAQCEEILRDRVRDGTFTAGDQLPPENELAEEFGVSRATVRTAINSLVVSGLVVRRHGVGNFVAAGTLLANDLTDAQDFNVLLASGGATVEVVFDAASIRPARPGVADSMQLGEEELVLETAKRFIADGDTMIYVVNSVPVDVLGLDLAVDAERRPEMTEPLFTFLEESAGARTALQLASLHAELGPSVDHPGADLEADVPVLRFDEVGYTGDNEPIWHSSNWFPPSEMSFELIRRRKGIAQEQR